MTPPKKTSYFPYTGPASILAGNWVSRVSRKQTCEVFQADGLTSSEGALNRGGFLDPNHPAIRWVSAWKKPGASYKKSLILDYQVTRGTRGEFGARNENIVCKKVAKISKKWRKTCFLCWWFSGSCIFVAGGWSFLWLVPFFLHRRIFLWALLSFDGACTPNNWTWPSQKNAMKRHVFFFHLFSFPTLWTSVPFLKSTGWKFLFSWM